MNAAAGQGADEIKELMERNGRTYGVSILNEQSASRRIGLCSRFVYTGGEGEVAIGFRFPHAGNQMLHMINDG
jgi:hypothetical protein